MPDHTVLGTNLRRRGYEVMTFDTAAEACRWLDQKIDNKTVGVGGSQTVEEMGLLPLLAAHNRIFYCARAQMRDAAQAEVYLSSVNAVAETGEIVNLDNLGNRAGAMAYGREHVYLLIGRNKIVPDISSALWRAQNIAAPRNARRIGVKTPCAVRGDRCYDCNSPERICRIQTTLLRCPDGIGKCTVVLIDETLGY